MTAHASDATRSVTLADFHPLATVAAWGVGATYLAATVCAALMPPALQASLEATPHDFWIALSHDPLAHLAYHWCWVLCGVFGMAAVPVICALVWRQRRSRGAVGWTALLAFAGFATHARSHLMEVAWDRKIIPLYEHADPAFQQAVHVVAGLALDVPDGLLTYAAIGLWVLVISWVARRAPTMSRWFSRLGIAAAVSLFAGALGYMFFIRPLLVFSIAAGGGVLIPAWFGWAGLLLLRASNPQR